MISLPIDQGLPRSAVSILAGEGYDVSFMRRTYHPFSNSFATARFEREGTSGTYGTDHRDGKW
jgi:hypothetical protein